MAADIKQDQRGGHAAVGYAVKSAAGDDPDTAPQQLSGAGIPSVAAPNGSTYQRSDPPDVDNCFYLRIGGVWIATINS